MEAKKNQRPIIPVIALLITSACLATPLYSQDSQTKYGREISGGPTYNGHTLTCHLPAYEHIKNIGSKVDGAGMCVTSSCTMSAIYQGMEDFRDFRDWCAQFSGGSWPDKNAKQIKEYCQQKGIKEPPFLQVETASPEKVMELIDKTGRMASITYGQAHMTCAPSYRGSYGVCLDNNRPGEWQWMSKQELIQRMRHHGKAWVFVWLTPPPPPPPIIRQ